MANFRMDGKWEPGRAPAVRNFNDCHKTALHHKSPVRRQHLPGNEGGAAACQERRGGRGSVGKVGPVNGAGPVLGP